MDPRRRNTLGEKAENRALARLRKAGLRLIKRNFRTRHGEIDLVMQDGNCLVFVEVRYRSRTTFAPAAISVDRRKQNKLIRAAEAFIVWHMRWQHCPTRFDVVAMNRTPNGELNVEWLQDAFRPE